MAFSTCGDTLFQPMRTMLNARLSSYGVRLPSQPPNQRLTEPEQCRALLREAGCVHIAVHTEQLGYNLRDVDEYWEDTVAWNGSWRGRIAQIPPEKLEPFRAEHLAEVSALATDPGFGWTFRAMSPWAASRERIRRRPRGGCLYHNLHRTTACSRRPPASAALPLPGAAEAQR